MTLLLALTLSRATPPCSRLQVTSRDTAWPIQVSKPALRLLGERQCELLFVDHGLQDIEGNDGEIQASNSQWVYVTRWM